MPLFDKVKAQATQVAQKAQEAGKAGQARLAESQAHKHADAMLRDLGLQVLASRTGRGTSDSEPDIEGLVAALVEFEAEHGSLLGSTPDDEGASGAPVGTVPTATVPTATVPTATVPTAGTPFAGTGSDGADS